MDEDNEIIDSVMPGKIGAKPASYLLGTGESGPGVLLMVDDQTWTLPLDKALKLGEVLFRCCMEEFYVWLEGGKAASE